MDEPAGRPAKGFVRSTLELLGLAQSAQTSRREARANILYAVVMVVLVGLTGDIPFGRRVLLLAVCGVVVYLLVSAISRFLPEPRRRSDIPPGSH